MLPITAWKSVLVIAAFLAVPAAIFLPAKHSVVPATHASFTSGQESDDTEAQYAKPSPFTIPAPEGASASKSGRRFHSGLARSEVTGRVDPDRFACYLE